MLTGVAAPVRSSLWLACRILDEPAQVFAQLVERPRALIPIVFMVIAGAVAGFGMPSSVLRSAAERQLRVLELRRNEPVPADERHAAVARSSSASGRAVVTAAAFANSLISVTFTAVVLMLAFKAITGSAIRFREEWAIAAHAFVPWIIGSTITVVMIAVLGDPSFRMGLGFLVNADRQPFLHSFADQFTFFGAWNMYLLALGNQIRIQVPRLSPVLSVVGAFWLLTNLIAAAISTGFASAGA